MPACYYDQTRPTVYLDTSTLAYAFDGAQVGAVPSLAGAAGLLPLIQEIAHRSNLVVSHFHLFEIVDHGDTAATLGIAAWLESLPLVWARFPHHVMRDEDDYWLKIVAGHRNPTPVRVFAPSMITAFEDISPSDSADLLRASTVVDVVKILRREKSLARRIKDNALEVAETFHHNRSAFVTPGTSETEVSILNERVNSQKRTELRRRAYAAHERLVAQSDREYTELAASLNDVVVPFSELFQSVPASFPLSKVEDRLNTGFISVAARRSLHSNSFGKLDSSLTDTFHAMVGAAYCSLFTCDRLTAEWLGDVRSQLGLRPAVMFSGDFDVFCRELRCSWQGLS